MENWCWYRIRIYKDKWLSGEKLCKIISCVRNFVLLSSVRLNNLVLELLLFQHISPKFPFPSPPLLPTPQIRIWVVNDTTSRWYGLQEQDIMAVICRDGGQQLKKCFFWLYIESTYSLFFPVRNMNIYEIIIPTAWRSYQVIDSLWTL